MIFHPRVRPRPEVLAVGMARHRCLLSRLAPRSDKCQGHRQGTTSALEAAGSCRHPQMPTRARYRAGCRRQRYEKAPAWSDGPCPSRLRRYAWRHRVGRGGWHRQSSCRRQREKARAPSGATKPPPVSVYFAMMSAIVAEVAPSAYSGAFAPCRPRAFGGVLMESRVRVNVPSPSRPSTLLRECA